MIGRAGAVARGVVCAALLVFAARLPSFAAAAAAAPAAEPDAEPAEVCSSKFVAFEGEKKVPKRQRLAARERAEDRAFLDLAQQAFAAGSYREQMEIERQVRGDSDRPDDGVYDEDIRLVQAGRRHYGVNDLLHGGTYHSEGDSSRLSVWYCLPAGRFATARADLRRERAEDVRRIASRMGELESAVARDELAWAAEEMSSLLGEIQSRVMETETYTSPLTGEEKSFRGWLAQWRSEVQRGTDYAMQLIEEASRKVKDGHLSVAEGLLDEAVEADPTNPRARQVRMQIEDRRAERAALLKSALDKAAVGRFAAAQSDLEKAEQIDADEARRLQVARRAVEDKKAEYLADNPRVSGDFYVAFGGLGADVDGASATYEATTAGVSNPNVLTTLGLSCRVGLGRHGLFMASAGYGFSSFSETAVGSTDASYYHYGELLGGLGFRTIRTARRPVRFVALGGVTQEFVSIDVSAPGLESSDSRGGKFARLAVEWRMFSVYLQQGFGFADQGDPEGSLVRWHDGTQFGLAIVF